MPALFIDKKALVALLKGKTIVEALAERDGYTCQFPGCVLPFSRKNPPTIDHWFPQCAGGDWKLENLKLMHQRCNAIKGDKIPREDGTFTITPRKDKISRAMKRSERPVVCESCKSGRLLGPDEECLRCGSGPMPPTFPQWAKMKPNDCTHEGIWWCWCCMSGIVQRVPASKSVFNGGEPGID